MQRLQHQPVTAQRHHDVGIGRIVIAVDFGQLRQRLLGFGAGARDKGDPVISLGLVMSSRARLGAEGRVPEVVYATPGIVSTSQHGAAITSRAILSSS